jgi:hypothetical protein
VTTRRPGRHHWRAVEREERHLARERARARKRLGLGVRGAAYERRDHQAAEPVYKPDLAAAFKIIDSVNSPEQLYGLAKISLNGIDAHRLRRDMSPKAAQGIANGLMIAALALLPSWACRAAIWSAYRED